MNTNGIFGPFENPDDVSNYWYQVTERDLDGSIKQVNEDLDDSDNSEGDIKIYQQDLEELTRQLKDLRSYVDDHTRCAERYKFDKDSLQVIQEDWHDYNDSLYAEWSRLQSYILGGVLRPNDDELKANREWYKSERIKREEIAKRASTLLTK